MNRVTIENMAYLEVVRRFQTFQIYNFLEFLTDISTKGNYFQCPPMSCHLTVVEGFLCPTDSGSYVVQGLKPLVGSPKANRS